MYLGLIRGNGMVYEWCNTQGADLDILFELIITLLFEPSLALVVQSQRLRRLKP